MIPYTSLKGSHLTEAHANVVLDDLRERTTFTWFKIRKPELRS